MPKHLLMETSSAERSLLWRGSEAPHSHLCLLRWGGGLGGCSFLLQKGSMLLLFDVVWLNASHPAPRLWGAGSCLASHKLFSPEWHRWPWMLPTAMSVTCLSPVLTSQIKKEIRCFWARQLSKLPFWAVLEQIRSRLKKKSPLQSYFAVRIPIKTVIFLIKIMWQPSRIVQCLDSLTSVFLGQVVSHLPVVIAVQDAVGDADVVGSHLMNALRDADDRRWGRGPCAPLGSYRADWRRARGHGWWSSCAPGNRC